MFWFSKKETRILIAELVVVVLGILIAFQVEEWRDNRSTQQELQASLSRLAEETNKNVDWCARFEPRFSRDAADAEIVFQSLKSGRLQSEDRVAFERGLAGASGLPPFRMRLSVIDEMISTGIVRQIDHEELRTLIAEIHSIQNFADSVYPSRREAIRDLTNGLFDYVDIETTRIDPQGPDVRVESSLESARGTIIERSLEGGTRISYDFDSLASNRRLINLFYNSLDSRVDQLSSVRNLCETNEKIGLLLRVMASE